MGAWARRASFAPVLLLALPLYGVARLLPAEGVGLWLRLVSASLLLLLPGALVARALRLRGASVAVAWALAALTLALAVVFTVHSSLWLALAVLGAVALAAFPFALRVRSGPPAWDTLAVALAGLGFGIALWRVAGIVHGDALFHLGRIRKLDAFGSLHLRTVDEFRDGGLHPGYAFPLWHGFVALVSKIAAVDPALALRHEPSALAPVAFAVTYEAGLTVFRRAWLAIAVLAASVALAALAPGEGGSYALLGQPGTADRQILVPAALAVFFLVVREPSWRLTATLAGLGLELFLVHASTAVFLAIPLLGFVGARALLARADLRSAPLALVALLAPAGLALVWLAPIVRETASHSPPRDELLRSLAKYAGDVHVDSIHRYAVRPEVFSRGGAVAVAALVAVPLAGLAARRRWAALVLGGSLAVLGVELLAWVFPHFADAVSLSQARREAGFVPFAFALAGGAAVVAGLVRLAVLPLALAAGIALQLAYGGGGPAAAAWIAAGGGAVALVAGLVLRAHVERRGLAAGLAVLLFVLPVAVHGFRAWRPAETSDPSGLTPGLLHALRTKVPERAVVFSDLETSYRIAAFAPVYVAAGPPAHVADTKANRPYARRISVIRFFRTGDLAIPRRFGAGWLVVDRRRFTDSSPSWPLVYSDDRFALYHRPA